MRPLLSRLLPAVTATLLLAAPAHAQVFRSLVLEYETGPVRVFQNDGRYGANGTLYRADDVGQQRVLLVGQRLAAELGLGQRHTAIFLYAPFDVTTTTTLDEALIFRDTTFPAGAVLQHRYKFDGIRASYLYRLLDWEELDLELGATLQIRNALVEFTSFQRDLYAFEDDIGLVGALKARVTYTLPSGIYGMLEVDGLSTFGLIGETTGGILDAALALGLPITQGADAVFKLRIYGGGATVPAQEIYSWGWYGFATAGIRGDLIALFAD